MDLRSANCTLTLTCRSQASTTSASGTINLGQSSTISPSSDVAWSFTASGLVSGQNVEVVCATGVAFAYGGYSASVDCDGTDWEGNALASMATWDAIMIEAASTNTGVCTVSFTNDQTQLELGPGEKALLYKSITTAAAETIILTGPAAGNDTLTVTVFATAA